MSKVGKDSALKTGHWPPTPSMSSNINFGHKPHFQARFLASAVFTRVSDIFFATVPIQFKAVGSAPILRQRVFKVSASQKFETVVNFLRKKLDCKPNDSVFLYINSVFAPGLDEGVGNLFRVRLLRL